MPASDVHYYPPPRAVEVWDDAAEVVVLTVAGQAVKAQEHGCVVDKLWRRQLVQGNLYPIPQREVLTLVFDQFGP